MKAPRLCSVGLLAAIGAFIGLAGASPLGQSARDSADAHVAAARTAAGQEHTAVFNSLCAAAPAPAAAPLRKRRLVTGESA